MPAVCYDTFTAACNHQFLVACKHCNETCAVSLYQQDPGVINQQDRYRRTGLMRALQFRRYTIARWLLSLPGLDTTVREQTSNITADRNELMRLISFQGNDDDVMMSAL